MAPLRHAGFTLVELLIVVALMGILAALCAPFLIAAKASANEASAISTLRALNSAQSAFSVTCGSGNYAENVETLVHAQFMGADTLMAPKSGFSLALRMGRNGVAAPADCTGAATMTQYYASVVSVGSPVARRGFATNQGGVIWEDRTGAAPDEPFTVTADVGPIQ